MDLTRFLLGDNFHPGGAALTRRLGTRALLHRDARVLDVASGRGATCAELTQQFGCRVTGIDYSQAHAAAVGGVRGDACRLPFATDSFDAVVCECALCTFADAGAAAREMTRVLRPAGRVAISDMVLQAAVPETLQGVLGGALCIAGARDRPAYQELLEGAGLQAVRVYDESNVLFEMLETIEARLAVGDLSNTPELENIGPVLAAARDFVGRGGLGYAVFVGRTPRA